MNLSKKRLNLISILGAMISIQKIELPARAWSACCRRPGMRATTLLKPWFAPIVSPDATHILYFEETTAP